jgi:sugar phosphate isomerase/epimerase
MNIKPFEPKQMKVGILTAALQELTPREVRDPDPDRAIEEWVEFASELGVGYIQLSAALHPTETDVPPEAMLDPVANTLDLRTPFDKARAKRVLTSLAANNIQISEIGYFDNMLHEDAAIRAKKHDFMMRVFDAAALLGVTAICGFVGRNQQHGMDENLLDFEQHFVPILEAAKARGLTFRVEQCPMYGWTTSDNYYNNIAYTPGTWIALHRIAEKHGVGDQFRIHYDPSHAILMGQDTRSIFQYLKDEGYGFLIGGFHVKGQVIDSKGVAAWGYGGQTVERGDWIDGKPSPDPADQLNAWKKQVVLCEHELPGTAKHDPLAYLQNRTVDWLDHPRGTGAAPARHREHVSHRRTRVPAGAHPGSRPAETGASRLGRLRARDRSGGGRDVRPPARGAEGAGDSGAGDRAAGVSFLALGARHWALGG